MEYLLILMFLAVQGDKTTLSIGKGGEKEYLFATEVLKPDLKPSYHIYLGEHRKGFRATKLTPKGTCLLKQIFVGVASLPSAGSTAMDSFSVSVCHDEGGKPGASLHSQLMSLKTDTAWVIHWNKLDMPHDIACTEITGAFWVVIQESDTSFPTLVFDLSRSLPSKIKKNAGDAWADTSFDWCLGALVDYSTAPKPAIDVEPKHLVIEVDSGKGAKKAEPNVPKKRKEILLPEK